MPTLRSATKYIKQGKFGELFFRSKLYAADRYGALKYGLAGKLNRERFKVVKVNGHRMYVNLDDKGISKDLYLFGSRERFAFDFLKKFLKEDDVILDIGANIGYYVLLEHERCPKGRIFACEPSDFNRKMLEMNLVLNDVTNAQVFPYALGEQTEAGREFYIYERSNWASFNKQLRSPLVDTVRVDTMTLDDFRDRHLGDLMPTVLRMDVEGAEFEIIKGAERTLRVSPNMKIFMEIHPHLLGQKKVDELLDILWGHGFEIRAIVNECQPYLYSFLNDRIWRSIERVPYGMLRGGYDELRQYLQINKGTEVFFEKSR